MELLKCLHLLTRKTKYFSTQFNKLFLKITPVVINVIHFFGGMGIFQDG